MSTSAHALLDAQRERKLLARWVVSGTLTLESALHLGGEGDSRVDMPILRDAREGKPLLCGATLAGAIRSALTDRLCGFAGDEEGAELVAQLFGGSRARDDGEQSPLIVFDALGELGDGAVELRDGLAILPETGAAEDGKKYDYEVLPAGTTFPVRVDLLIAATSSRAGQEPVPEARLLLALATALEGFRQGDIALGGKRSRGLGCLRGRWCARRFDLSDANGWTEWALFDSRKQPGAKELEDDIGQVLRARAPLTDPALAALPDRRRRVLFDLDLAVLGDLLVGSPGTDPGGPDVVQLQSGSKDVLPGTSLAGPLRLQALRILRLVRADEKDAAQWVDRLFGPRFEDRRPTAAVSPRASRLRVGEAWVRESGRAKRQRIALDRFTQAPVPGALFDARVAVGGRIGVRLELRDPLPGELGLVLLVLKDLLDGRVPVGGTSGVGRGWLKGSAEVVLPNAEGGRGPTVKLEPGRAPSGDGAGAVDVAIRELLGAKRLGNAAAPVRAAASEVR